MALSRKVIFKHRIHQLEMAVGALTLIAINRIGGNV